MTDKPIRSRPLAGVHARIIDLSEPGAPPGFRVTAETLPNEQAIAAMLTAVTAMTEAALAHRYDLLSLGFAADHSLCAELDRTATQYADAASALRRQERAV